MALNKRKLFTVTLFALFLSVFIGSSHAQISFSNGSSYKYLKGSQASSLSPEWIVGGFNDSNWSTGNSPYRYGDGTGGTEMLDMQNSYSTVFLRTSFIATNVSQLNNVEFSLDYDDGVVLWLNGVKIINQYAPAPLNSTSIATMSHESGTIEKFVIHRSDLQLIEGNNVLAVQLLNSSLESSDLFFDMSIRSVVEPPIFVGEAAINFSHKSGFYDAPFDLTITSSDATTNIVYTIDGSNPQKSSTAITSASSVTIRIDPASNSNRATTPSYLVRASVSKPGFTPSISRARSYIFLNNVKTQDFPGGGWPNTYINDQKIDLAMDPDIVNDPRYKDQIEASFKGIPTISVITDLKNLFDTTTGIYVNAEKQGHAWEKECAVELINPDGTPGFNVNAGLRIRGGWSRHPEFPKHSFRLFFRAEYGDAKLNYPLFGSEGVDKFDKIDLRCEQNYSWAHGDSKNTLVREVFSRDTQRDMNRPYTRSRYYQLYLNGMYWGIYQSQERAEANYAESYLGDKEEDYDVIKVNTEDFSYKVEATDGESTNWNKVYMRCINGFSSNESYFKLEGKDEKGFPVKNSEVLVDIDNLIDYMLLIFYTGNFDAPVSKFAENKGANNFYIIDNRNDKSKGFQFLNHDAEHSMFDLNENRVNIGGLTDNYKMELRNGFAGFHPQWLHFKLSENAEYRMRFQDRAYKRMTESGALTPAKSIERLNKRIAEIENAVVAESARWGDSRSGTTRTKDDHWLPEINYLRNTYLSGRTHNVIQQLREAGLFSSLNPPTVKIGGKVITDSIVTINGSTVILMDKPFSQGIIYFTVDGTDPREVSGVINEKAQIISTSGLTVVTTTILKARVYDKGTWSPLREIKFALAKEDYSNLKITEIHYNPKDLIVGTDTTFGKDYEFIEFKNTGTSAIDLSGILLDSGVTYTFPNQTFLAPQNFFVIASKPSTFYSRYGLVASGNFGGNLSNSGEKLVLSSSDKTSILNLTYDDKTPWPESADGKGYSLVSALGNPSEDPALSEYWKASKLVDGSPFKDDDAQQVTGIDEEIGKGALYAFPNPTSGLLFVNIAVPFMRKTGVMKLYDLNGKLLHISKTQNANFIDLESLKLNSGMYILKLRGDNYLKEMKIIYQKK